MNVDDRAQMYVLEAILAGFIVLGTVVAVQYVNAPTAPDQEKLAQLKATGDDALRTLDHTPPGTAQADYDYTNSTLVMHVSRDETAAMQTFLAQALPSNARYEVLLRNASTSQVWIDGNPPRHGEIVVSHRLVAIRDPPLGLEGVIIDVQLKLWFV